LRHVRLAIATTVALAALVVVGAAWAGTTTKTIISSGTISVPNEPAPTAGPQGTDEIRPGTIDVDAPISDARGVGARGGTAATGSAPTGGTTSRPTLVRGFSGLNFFQQRFANGGNQFSLEPPDQGLCVGNGKVVEVINSVYRVFDTRGNALINPVDLNHLFGYADAINRKTRAIGPDVFDPTCLFDAQTNTFFIVASTLDVAPDGSGAFTGTSHVDILAGSDPTGTLTKFSIDTTNAMACFNDARKAKPGPCFPDFPQIGADANGFYVTINTFDFFGPSFEGVTIYALPKAPLASGAMSVPVTNIDTNGIGPAADGGQIFTAIPAVTPVATQFSTADGGTELFASSRAIFTGSGTASTVEVIRLGNTSSLAGTANLHLSASTVGTQQYSVPSASVQKAGDVPLATCIGSQEDVPALGIPCWKAVGIFTGLTHVSENVLDANDSRVGGVSFANGQLWVTLGTGTSTAGQDGVAWFVINDPAATPSVANQGTLAKDGANLTYPSIAATAGGAGALSFTIVGPNDYPSSGFAGLSATTGASAVQYAAHGAGPQDGFTEYEPFFTNRAPRPRWGDYGAAVADGRSIWVASEYIGQTCTFDQYLQPSPTNTSAFGTCGDTRGALGNWYTRISQLTP
jgi:hypothetical protein